MKQRRTPTATALQTMGHWDFQSKRLETGYDHVHHAAVLDGRYMSCNPTIPRVCDCYGCQHDNEMPGLGAQIIDRRQGGISSSEAT